MAERVYVTLAEKQVVWVCTEGRCGRKSGLFRETLIRAMMQANDENRRKLRTVFPELMEAVEAWKDGKLYECFYAAPGGV